VGHVPMQDRELRTIGVLGSPRSSGSRNMPTGGLGLAGVHLVFGGGMMFLTRIQRGTRVPTGGPPVDERAHPYAVLREVLTT
jgi:hypothetical protein